MATTSGQNPTSTGLFITSSWGAVVHIFAHQMVTMKVTIFSMSCTDHLSFTIFYNHFSQKWPKRLYIYIYRIHGTYGIARTWLNIRELQPLPKGAEWGGAREAHAMCRWSWPKVPSWQMGIWGWICFAGAQVVFPGFPPCILGLLYPLVNKQFAIENGHL